MNLMLDPKNEALIEAVARAIHEADDCEDTAWPEYYGDTGKREDGYSRIVALDIQSLRKAQALAIIAVINNHQQNLGIKDYKVVCDQSELTPEDSDRYQNMLKITTYVQPNYLKHAYGAPIRNEDDQTS